MVIIELRLKEGTRTQWSDRWVYTSHFANEKNKVPSRTGLTPTIVEQFRRQIFTSERLLRLLGNLYQPRTDQTGVESLVQ
jgi:hypothetical protein